MPRLRAIAASSADAILERSAAEPLGRLADLVEQRQRVEMTVAADEAAGEVDARPGRLPDPAEGVPAAHGGFEARARRDRRARREADEALGVVERRLCARRPRAALHVRATAASHCSAASGRRASWFARTPVTMNGTRSARSLVCTARSNASVQCSIASSGSRATRAVSASPQMAGSTSSTSPLARPIASESSNRILARSTSPRPNATNPRASREPRLPRRLPRSTSSISAIGTASSQRPAAQARCAEVAAITWRQYDCSTSSA